MTDLYRLWHWWLTLTGRDRATIILEALGVVVVTAYTFQACRANQLTRETLALSQRSTLIAVPQRDFSITDDPGVTAADSRYLAAGIQISNESKNATAYWAATTLRYSTVQLSALWNYIPTPERRMMFFGDYLAAQSNQLPAGLPRTISIGQGKGWLYLGVWLWYGSYGTFLCREYKLPSLYESKECSDPNSNYAD